jgi:hypothetical protein
MMDSSFNLYANQFILEDYVMNFVLLFSHIFLDEMDIVFATTKGLTWEYDIGDFFKFICSCYQWPIPFSCASNNVKYGRFKVYYENFHSLDPKDIMGDWEW